MDYLTDQQLLRDFSRDRSEAAFSELVRRHLDFVYSAALRMVGDSYLAEDVSQSVFIALAQNASGLTHYRSVAGWLHRTARNLAANVVRSEVRRRRREEKLASMNEPHPTEAGLDPGWEQLAPHLDAALEELSEPDREVLLLRYFQKKSARDMAQLLGISDEAAQKRVNRAVERLRELVAKHSLAMTAAGLAAVISTHAIQAAPIGLAGAITASALLVEVPVVAATVTKAIVMTTLQKTAVVASLTALIGAGIFEARQAAQAKDEAAALRQLQIPLAATIRQLTSERDQARSSLAALTASPPKIQSASAELARLRGELARLRGNAGDAADPFVRTALTWKEKEARLRQLFQDKPEQNIPELRLLEKQAWLNAAMNANLDTEKGVREAMSDLRMGAENQFFIQLMSALQSYSLTNGSFPGSLAQLTPYINSTAADDLGQRYELVPADQYPSVKLGDGLYITEKNLVDPENDSRWIIGAYGFTKIDENAATTAPVSSPGLTSLVSAYAAANNGKMPTDPSQLQPYATTSDQQAALQQLIQAKPKR